MSLDAVIAIYIIPIVKLLMTFSFTKTLSLISSLIYLAAISVIILYNAKSLIRLKISLIILGNLFAN